MRTPDSRFRGTPRVQAGTAKVASQQAPSHRGLDCPQEAGCQPAEASKNSIEPVEAAVKALEPVLEAAAEAVGKTALSADNNVLGARGGLHRAVIWGIDAGGRLQGRRSVFGNRPVGVAHAPND